MKAISTHVSKFSALVLCLGSVSAAAETGLYLGLGVGGAKIESELQTDIQYYEADLLGNPNFNAPVGGPVEIDFSEYDAAFKAFAGYRVLDWLAVEGGWIYLGEPDGTQQSPDRSTRIQTDYELQGWTADVVAFLRFNEQWEAFGKVGVFVWENDIQSNDRSATSGSAIGNPTDGFLAVVPSVWEDDENGEDLKGGLGMQYLHDSNLALRGEFEYFDVDGTDNVWLISFAAIWRFD
jgi:OOP family OmpA-OmpF porin